MKLFNTLTNKKEEFKPLKEGEVSIYVCGPTVYNYVHIGNTRPMIVFDVLRRTFEYQGNKVTFVSNFTDVDDKIIKAAKQEGISEKELTDKVAKGDSFEELEKIIFELNEKYRIKGEYESVISQLNEVEENIDTLNEQIDNIDNYLFSGDFETLLKEQVKKFNKIFSNISQELYGEKYALTFKKETNKKEQQFYKFNAFNANMSSGKKQGEILCFDLAYLLFADEEGLPCLHFLLNDKKELMHDNQLIKVAEFIQNKNIQLVISILKDKLPKAVLDKAHIAVELSQQEKLFRIENG